MEGPVLLMRTTTRTLHPGTGTAEAFPLVYFCREEMVFCAVSHLEWLWNASKPLTRGWVPFNKSYYPGGYWRTLGALNCKDHTYCFRHNCPQIGLNPQKRINHTSLTISLSMFANLFCPGLQRHLVNAAQKRSRNTVSHGWFGLVFNWSHPVLNPRVEPILQGFLEGLTCMKLYEAVTGSQRNELGCM